MKNIIYPIVVLLFVSLAGCGFRAEHPTKPRSEWSSDNSECEKMVRETIREAPPGMYNAGDEMRLIKRCMKEKGWQ